MDAQIEQHDSLLGDLRAAADLVNGRADAKAHVDGKLFKGRRDVAVRFCEARIRPARPSLSAV